MLRGRSLGKAGLEKRSEEVGSWPWAWQQVMDGQESAQDQAVALTSRPLPSKELRAGWQVAFRRPRQSCGHMFSRIQPLKPLSWVLLCIRVPCHLGVFGCEL